MFGKEFAVGLKAKTITESEELKRKLNKRSISELRVLKANAKTLSEWNKILTVFLAVICIVSTLLVGITTNIKQNESAIKSSTIDSLQTMKIANIDQIKEVDDTTKQTLKQMITESTEKSKLKLWEKNDTFMKIAMIPIVILIIFFIYFIFASRRSFYLNNIIHEAIEEKMAQIDRNSRIRDDRLERKYIRG
ncbi:hypothetical protein H1230_19740 [Paenibacillus sp. 19GGS1-52]|uniref:hypothetical protein n=1 Tax=Paenibacillus sp. 19GGS1-52 TaxID=2758563 RepID=UPI001EFB4F42|nr:hypothetical protein [Paenibacillus sp. 19GGS1-52]ULO05322.1 hypothetical protein H1230_19740 [Paenibacillus sp. 19GGS1-52]